LSQFLKKGNYKFKRSIILSYKKKGMYIDTRSITYRSIVASFPRSILLLRLLREQLSLHILISCISCISRD